MTIKQKTKNPITKAISTPSHSKDGDRRQRSRPCALRPIGLFESPQLPELHLQEAGRCVLRIATDLPLLLGFDVSVLRHELRLTRRFRISYRPLSQIALVAGSNH
jgi:hypothetical protein